MKKYFLYSAMLVMFLVGLSIGFTSSVKLSIDVCFTVGKILAVISFVWAVTNTILLIKKGD